MLDDKTLEQLYGSPRCPYCKLDLSKANLYEDECWGNIVNGGFNWIEMELQCPRCDKQLIVNYSRDEIKGADD